MQKKAKAVYVIVEGEKLERPMFRRIGSAFVNRDDSINVILDALPVGGRLHIRDVEPLGRSVPVGETHPDEQPVIAEVL